MMLRAIKEVKPQIPVTNRFEALAQEETEEQYKSYADIVKGSAKKTETGTTTTANIRRRWGVGGARDGGG